MKKTVKTILTAAVAAAAAAVQAVEIEMYQTTERRPFRKIENIVPFSPHCAVAVPVLDLDGSKVSHEFKGLGVSFAEASCKLLSGLSPERRREFLEMVFSRKGAGVTLGRIHVGCSDYSAHIYTYDDVKDDMELKHFSIDPDRKYVIPVIKEAQSICPELYFFGSVWTPPAWMKLGGDICGGWIDIEKIPVFCDYYVRFLQEYAKEGIEVSAISAQNEPYSDQNGESPECKWGPNEEMLFAGRYMPPRLKAAGLKTEIWLHDSEPDEWRQVLWELSDENVRKNTGGVAFHSYGGNPLQFLPKIREKYPDLPMYHTEQGPHLDGSRTITWWGAKVTSFINAGCSAFTSWCLALDEQGLPNVSRGFNCAGFIEIHSETGKFTPSAQWEYFRHLGPYVMRGAKVLDTGYAAEVPHPGAVPARERHVIAFRNPDGSHVIVATNANGGNNRKMQLQVRLGGEYVSFQLPPKSVSTIVLK